MLPNTRALHSVCYETVAVVRIEFEKFTAAHGRSPRVTGVYYHLEFRRFRPTVGTGSLGVIGTGLWYFLPPVPGALLSRCA